MKKILRQAICMLLVLLIVVTPVFAAETGTNGGSQKSTLNKNTNYQGSNLPQVHITVTSDVCTGLELTKDVGYVSATIEIIDPNNESNYLIDAGSQIKVRGNSTAGGEKRPYNFKLSSKQNVLEMGKGKKWCLLANMFDKSLMRNKLAFGLAQAIGLGYTPDFRMVDVWMDGVYVGNYMLAEPVEVNSTRVDINIDTGDYLFERERERVEDGVTYVTTSRYGLRFVMAEPEVPTAEQTSDILARLDQVETAIDSNDYDAIAQYINVQSFIDLFVVEEVFKNCDVDFSSTKFYFKDGVLYAGPVWDFDLSCGNCSNDYYDYNNLGTTGNSYESFYASLAIWYPYLFLNEQFAAEAEARFFELQPQIINLYQDNELGQNQIDQTLAECGESFEANWTAWSENSQDSTLERVPDATFEENVEYLRNWLRLRNEWLIYAFENDLPMFKTKPVVSGVYTIKSAVDQNYVLNVNNQSQSNGASFNVAQRIYSDSQRFVIEDVGSGYYTVRALHSGRYMEAANSGTADGTAIWQRTYNANSDAQKWKIMQNSDGTYSFYVKYNEKALDLSNGIASEGAKVQLWTSNGSDAQKWVLEAQTTLPNGIYKLGCSVNTNYVLSATGNGSADGTNVCLWQEASINSDQWVVQTEADGFCRFRELNSNKYLDVNGNGATSGTNVQLWTSNTSDAQKWSAVPNTDGTWSFFAVGSGKALDVSGGVAANQQNVQIWEKNGSAAQKWSLEAQRSVNDGVYSLASKTAGDQTVHVLGCSTEKGAGLVMWERENVMWEKIAVEYVGDGYYSLRMLNSNLYLDVQGNGSNIAPGAKVIQYAASDGSVNGDNELWRIVPNDDGSYNLVSKVNNLHLDRPYGANDNGTVIQVWTPTRSDPQRWTLTPTTVGLEGVWNIAASGNNSYVLNINQSSTSAGANLTLNRSNGGDNQKFIVQSIEDQYYVIRALHSGRVLNIDNGSSANGTKVLQWNSKDIPDSNERWQIIPNADGTYSFVGVCNGLYLDLSNNTLANGTNVQMWSHDATTAAQRWNLTDRYAVVEDGAYQFLSASDTSFALNVAAENEEAAMANGANVILSVASGTARSQQMYLRHVGNGYYTIMNQKSGKYLDVQDGALISGTNIQQYASNNNGDSQLWSVLPNNDGTYTFVSKCGGKTMDVESGTMAEGTNIRTWNGNATSAQKWQLSPASHIHTPGEVLETVAPTCTGQGYTVYCCTECGETYTEFVDAKGHTVVIDEAVAPTCTEDGLTKGSHCAVCDEVLVAQEVVKALAHQLVLSGKVAPTCTEQGYTVYVCANCGKTFRSAPVEATGHTEVVDEAVSATCTEDGLTEGKHCSVCGEILVAQQTITAFGHSYTYTDNGDGTHTVTCANCGDTFTEAHTFTDGTCICGAVESTEPTVDNTISIGQQLSLESDLSLTFRIKESQLTAYDVSTAYLVVERDIYPTGGEMYVKTDMLTEYTIENSRLVFVYSGIAAAQMNDEIRVTLHIKDSNGKDYVSNPLTTSVTAYAKLLLDAYGTTNEKLCTVLMDMLNYGTAAQLYFDRHADAPANTAYAEFANYASYASADFVTPLEDLSSVLTNEAATATMNLSVELATQIGVIYKVTLPEGVNAADATVVVKDEDGNELETLSLADGTVDTKGRYVVTYFGTPSRLMRRVVYGTVYVDGTAISNTYGYSISTYAYQIANTAGMPEALVNLTNLMTMYGDAANAYFGG